MCSALLASVGVACGDNGGAGGTGTDSDAASSSGGGTDATATNATTQATSTPTTTDSGGSDSNSAGQTNSSGVTDASVSTTNVTVTSGGGACGDGTLDPGEACDDGVNDGGYGGCMPDCSAPGPACGDGVVNGPETCDDGNQIDDDACSNACVAPVCGDGVVQAGEACDDGNMDDSDACVAGCQLATCGDMFVQLGVEVCDDGVNDGAYGGCAMDCSAKGPSCGDGVKNGPEACDDANADSKDGCLADCSQPPDCKAIKAFDPMATDGVYTLTVGNTTWQAYCDMTFDGGGWTLAAKVIPTDGWSYANARWTNNMLVNANMPDFDHTTAKLATWNLVPFTELLVGVESPQNMQNPPTPQYLKLALAANSLFAVFSPGTYVPTMGTKAGWQGLVPMPSLQNNCNQEGINNAPAMAGGRVRIGFLGSTLNNCMAPDSGIGLGFGGFACQNNPYLSVGDINCGVAPAAKRIGMGFLFVR